MENNEAVQMFYEVRLWQSMSSLASFYQFMNRQAVYIHIGYPKVMYYLICVYSS